MSVESQRIHFIAIGGGAMHQLAIALKNLQKRITGSDDEIFEPSRSALEKAGLLPETIGWDPARITPDLDLVVVGMHARADNPELARAKELGIRTLSYPELIYEHASQKQRIVIAGSHGKTTTTGMIMHVLRYFKRDFDYLVGARIRGFDSNVRLSEDAPVMVIEGDEYYASPELKVPKFLVYKHHIGLVTGVAWDHINIFPSEHSYVRQFDHFADASPKAGILVFNEEDPIASVICHKERTDVTVLEYGTPKYVVRNGVTHLIDNHGKEVPVKFFGAHNVNNANGARTLLSKLSVTDDMFYEAIQSFEGAANRLEKIAEGNGLLVFKDFAHAPSKLEATTKAVKDQYPQRRLTAVLELHTFSSLNPEFIHTYKDAFEAADEAVVYFNPEVVKHKKLTLMSSDDLKAAFNRPDLKVMTDSRQLFTDLKNKRWSNEILLLMSSGSFNQTDIQKEAQELVAS